MRTKIILFALLAASWMLAAGGVVSATVLTHTVEPGESLSVVAEKSAVLNGFGQPDWRRLCDANDIVANPNLIFVGQELRIPDASEKVESRAACELPVAAPIVNKPVAPQSTPTRSTGNDSRAVASQSIASAGLSSGDDFARLRGCESNGYGDKRSSTYRGAYQFDLATWRSVGGSGDPADASPSEQDDRARRLQAREGWGPWPSCSAQLGLR